MPPEQPVVPGEARDYVGIYVVDEEPRMVIALTNPVLKFGRIENWSPVFKCDLPIVISPSERKERFFQIRFTGIPSEREAFVRERLCVRSVAVVAIHKMFEGQNLPIVR